MRGYMGKYREIVLAVACFLLFDLAVLVLNFYISFQISESAVSINLAGRQRMLSQRMTKELLEAEYDQSQGLPTDEAVSRLQKSVALFDSTLLAFRTGGSVIGGNGSLVALAPVQTDSGKVILAEAEALWRPFHALMPDSSKQASLFLDLNAATHYARTHNADLLAKMNQLTTDLERSANARANTLRLVQTAGILLALLNFAFILFKFVRRLRDNDQRIEAAQSETTEILNTVKEGLFLLDQNFCIGSQYSASLPNVLGCKIDPGSDFRNILRELVPAEEFKTSCEYIGLLLGDRVKEVLVKDLNPLVAMPVNVTGSDGLVTRRYLTLQFNRVLVAGKVSHLLVTVFDVTEQVDLENALVETRAKAKEEVEVMLDLLKVNPDILRQFLERSEKSLLEINDYLRHVDDIKNHRRVLADIFRHVHTIKGEAAVIGLAMFEDLAQEFEAMLSGLRSRDNISGSDLLALPLPLDDFLRRITAVRELGRRLSAYQSAFPSANEFSLMQRMDDLVQRIAMDHGKKVFFEADIDLIESMPLPKRADLQDIALQLLRNSIVHGIEMEDERRLLNKPIVGSVYMTLRQINNEYEFMFRDDGCGLQPERIAQALVAKGLYSQAQVEELGERQLLMKIFESGLSTSIAGGRDAGQGVGMDVVKHKLQAMGARLQISTRRDSHTQFRIRFAA